MCKKALDKWKNLCYIKHVVSENATEEKTRPLTHT